MGKKSTKSATEQQSETLEHLLLALQKTLSRVNRESSNVAEGKPRSLIVGDVDFNLSCRCNLASGDKLELNDKGGITLDLSGHINTDIGVVRLEEDNDASSE